ncbi:origin recognition complex, subunit 2 [Boletus edulis]|nr:origin recognition complex, subunit 2 [Boletus edulis]
MDTDTDVSDNDQTHLLNVLNGADADAQHVRAAFDAYFVQAASRVRTSANVFSTRVLPLTQQEYNDSIAAYNARTADAQPSTRWFGHHDARTAFRRYAHELDQGFNLVFYGFGSKRAVLNDFATKELAHRGHVIAVNGYHPNITLKDVLASIERVPSLTNASATGTDAQVRRICFFFSAADAPRTRRLYLVIHNIDAPPMRAQKMRNALSLLALSPNIHLVASVDKINVPLLWSASELLARKISFEDTAASLSSMEGHTASPKRGYAFLWHDLTTLIPYDTELSFADRSSISGASYASTGARSALATTNSSGSGAPLTETAVAHVIAAVTSKAKKLFILLGSRQLENAETASGAAMGSDAPAPTDMAQFGLGYDALFSLAREHFVATSDTALRALLGEFKDHGLILAGAAGGSSGGGDTLWIPLRKERLVRVLKSIETEAP